MFHFIFSSLVLKRLKVLIGLVNKSVFQIQIRIHWIQTFENLKLLFHQEFNWKSFFIKLRGENFNTEQDKRYLANH